MKKNFSERIHDIAKKEVDDLIDKYDDCGSWFFYLLSKEEREKAKILFPNLANCFYPKNDQDFMALKKEIVDFEYFICKKINNELKNKKMQND